jgi:hypothetical protein
MSSMVPSLVAVGTYALLLARNEYLYAFLLLSQGHRRHPRGRPRQFSRRRRLAVGAADGHGRHLCDAAGCDLFRLQALHGGRSDRGGSKELDRGRTARSREALQTEVLAFRLAGILSYDI